jgi:AhpD family alkylhydroperoxidase
MSPRLDYRRAAPEGFQALGMVEPYLASCSIEPKLRALIELRVSQINGCAYCVDKHSVDARRAGETQQRLDCLTVWRETPFFTDREQAALAWAESVTLVSQTSVPESLYTQVRPQFSESELADLTLVIAVMNAWNRIAISFRKGPLARVEHAAAES